MAMLAASYVAGMFPGGVVRRRCINTLSEQSVESQLKKYCLPQS